MFTIKKIRILLLFLTFIIILNINLFSSEVDNENLSKEERFSKEKITLEVERKFDVRYPLNIKLFHFYQNGKKFNFKEFLEMTKDPFLLENGKRIKKIRTSGFSVAAVSGVIAGLALSAGVIFLIHQLNFNPIDSAFTTSGVGMFGLTFLSLVVLFVDLIITFSLIQKYKYNEFAVRQALERYNEALRKKLGIFPDLSFKDNSVKFCFNILL